MKPPLSLLMLLVRDACGGLEHLLNLNDVVFDVLLAHFDNDLTEAEREELVMLITQQLTK